MRLPTPSGTSIPVTSNGCCVMVAGSREVLSELTMKQWS